MNVKMIGRILSRILALEAVFMIPPLLIALFTAGFGPTFAAFAISIGVLIAVSLGLFAFGRKADKRRKLYNGTLKCQFYMYLKN